MSRGERCERIFLGDVDRQRELNGGLTFTVLVAGLDLCEIVSP